MYEINISLNGHHHFATAKRSLGDQDTLIEVYNQLEKAFPCKDGYKLSVSYLRETSQRVDIKEIIAKKSR